MKHSATTTTRRWRPFPAWPLALCLGLLGLGSLRWPLSAGAEPCRVIEGGGILGRDLAAAVPSLADLDPDAVIAPLPLAGVQRVFRPDDLARIAREHSLPPPERPLTTCFVRKTMLLTPELLAPAVEQALRPPAAAPDTKTPPGNAASAPAPHIEILDFSRYAVPEGALSFRRAALLPSGLWRGQVSTPEGGHAPVWVRVRLTDPVSGVPLALGPTPEVRDVNRGDPVRVEVSFGRAVIAFDSIAESSGRKGEMVLVKNPDKSRRLLARVEDKGKVAIRK